MQNTNLTEKKSGKNCKKNNKNLLSHIKMGKDILTFGDTEIEKNKFYHHKSPVFLRRCRYWESISN